MKQIALLLIRFYQRCISPLFPAKCRFYPTCSAYAIEAFQKRGFFVGFGLTVRRICRCNPFGGHGYDPVPEKGFRCRPLTAAEMAENFTSEQTKNEKEN